MAAVAERAPAAACAAPPVADAGADARAVARAVAAFRAAFGPAAPLCAAAAAPGRVNVVGDHTDYCDGFVLPLAIDKSTYLVGGPSEDGRCHVTSSAFPGEVAVFDAGDSVVASDLPKWARYLKGMTAVYARSGKAVPPFRAAVVSDLPLGCGLSSSAALEMATGVLIEALSGVAADPVERALLGQKCEHEFAGVPCGIMDQLISSKGEAGKALLIDCRSLECTPAAFDDPEAVLIVANSNVTHELSGSEYPERRKATEDAAAVIAARFPNAGVKLLRDCTLAQLAAVAPELGEVSERRARHIIEDNARVISAKAALDAADMQKFGRLMYASHISLRDLFEVSTKEIDALVDIAMAVDGVYGSRITGGGFGGCSVTLVKKSAVQTLLDAIGEKYPAVSGGSSATVFATRAGPGARRLPLLEARCC